MNDKTLNIAVVGAGVAGITTAHILQRKHKITLFEKNDYLGGHTNTVEIQNGPDAGTAVDTGFIVLNDRTYPTFHNLLDQLNVLVRNSDMSFGFHCEKTNLQYCGTNLNTLFAQRSNLFNVSFLRMLYEISRFGKIARENLKLGIAESRTLGQYVDDYGYSQSFIHDYLLPMGAAIWSTPSKGMLDFPAQTFIDFFNNHGLLSLKIPQWQTVIGGSYTYVKAFRDRFQGEIVTNQPIQTIHRNEQNVSLELINGEKRDFDCVVIACHADQSLSLLNKPTRDEKRLLGVWNYTENRTVLHCDSSVMPTNTRAWAAWNYTREKTAEHEERLSLTYYMNRLQGFETSKNYFVTLNRSKSVNPQTIIKEIIYKHPSYDFKSVASQEELPKLNGVNHTYFCGSYFGYGFHEDAVKSGVAVANQFGLEL